MGRGSGGIGEKIQGLKSIIGRYKNRQRDIENNTRNGEAKELTCTTHAHELR